MADQDPHADLHDLAAPVGASDPAPAPTQAGETPDEKIDRIAKELTGRINKLRSDNDAFKKAVSNSVKAVQDNLDTAKTDIQNNADAIKAQDELIGEAKKSAAEAKTAADAAVKKADAVRTDLTNLTTDVRAFESRYAVHTHDVEITMHGETNGPKEGN